MRILCRKLPSSWNGPAHCLPPRGGYTHAYILTPYSSYSAAGVLILVLLNMSNPFLHVAKVVHYMEL